MCAMVNQRTSMVQAMVSARKAGHHQRRNLINHKVKNHGVRRELEINRGPSQHVDEIRIIQESERMGNLLFKINPKTVQGIE